MTTMGKLSFVLSGGGARGVFEAGALQRLAARPDFREPAIVAGTSAGAINAALHAAGKTPEELKEFWFGLADVKPARTNDAFVADFARELVALVWRDPARTFRAVRARLAHHHGPLAIAATLLEVALTDRYDLTQEFLARVRSSHFAKIDALRAHLIDVFGGENVPTHRCALAINAVDARTNGPVRFVTASTPHTRGAEYVVVPRITVEMVLASVSIPLLFPAIRTTDRLLWDGGILNNTPLAPAVALGADRVVTVLVAGHTVYGEPDFRSLGQALERLLNALLENAYNVDRQLLLARNHQAASERRSGQTRYRHVLLYEPIRPSQNDSFGAGSLLDFRRPVLDHMYREGQQAAAAWLLAGPREDAGESSSQRPAAPASAESVADSVL